RRRISSGSLAGPAASLYCESSARSRASQRRKTVNDIMIELRPGAVGYPALLGAVSSAPALFVRGELRDEDSLAIAIVGSRRATPYRIAAPEELAADLAARGVTIVRGLARGIDTAAHRSALAAGGRPLAVLGCGVDVVYPPENAPLARAIESHGAILSQFPPGM